MLSFPAFCIITQMDSIHAMQIIVTITIVIIIANTY